jgi:hypothetical protein
MLDVNMEGQSTKGFNCKRQRKNVGPIVPLFFSDGSASGIIREKDTKRYAFTIPKP